jgi:hypothetical protein
MQERILPDGNTIAPISDFEISSCARIPYKQLA